jgi:hypothetical protein
VPVCGPERIRDRSVKPLGRGLDRCAFPASFRVERREPARERAAQPFPQPGQAPIGALGNGPRVRLGPGRNIARFLAAAADRGARFLFRAKHGRDGSLRFVPLGFERFVRIHETPSFLFQDA